MIIMLITHRTTLSWPKDDFPLSLLLPNHEIMPWSPISPQGPLYPIFYFAAFLVCLVFGQDRANPSASFQGVTEKFFEYWSNTVAMKAAEMEPGEVRWCGASVKRPV